MRETIYIVTFDSTELGLLHIEGVYAERGAADAVASKLISENINPSWMHTEHDGGFVYEYDAYDDSQYARVCIHKVHPCSYNKEDGADTIHIACDVCEFDNCGMRDRTLYYYASYSEESASSCVEEYRTEAETDGFYLRDGVYVHDNNGDTHELFIVSMRVQ